MKKLMIMALLLMMSVISACELESSSPATSGGSNGNTQVVNVPPPASSGGTDADWIVTVRDVPQGETGRVTRIIDGDTIDVEINGQTFRVRYIGVNTPERGEACYSQATTANSVLVSGQTVRLERDRSETDRFDRLLRYVYVGDVFVNATLVRQGYAEAVLYRPDGREHQNFVTLEQEAARNNRNCHTTGIFDDGSYER